MEIEAGRATTFPTIVKHQKKIVTNCRIKFASPSLRSQQDIFIKCLVR